eukprot:scaffold663820_cov51-Prasinocladus_malaysianus.AAC.2
MPNHRRRLSSQNSGILEAAADEAASNPQVDLWNRGESNMRSFSTNARIDTGDGVLGPSVRPVSPTNAHSSWFKEGLCKRHIYT